MIYGWALVIFLTALVVMLGFAALLGRGLRELDRIRLLDELDQAVDMPQLPRAGRFPAGEPFDLPGVLASMTYVCNRCGLPQRACVCPKGPQNPWPLAGPYGPFPVDTGPLLLLSEQAAANIALEREIEQRCAEAEAKIPPRWR